MRRLRNVPLPGAFISCNLTKCHHSNTLPFRSDVIFTSCKVSNSKLPLKYLVLVCGAEIGRCIDAPAGVFSAAGVYVQQHDMLASERMPSPSMPRNLSSLFPFTLFSSSSCFIHADILLKRRCRNRTARYDSIMPSSAVIFLSSVFLLPTTFVSRA